MRFVDLQVGAERGTRLELHPKLTVVVAGAKTLERLASLLGRAYVLAGTEITGTVDGGGYLTPFDPTAVVSLDLVGEGPTLLGPSVLPPPDPAPREAARRVLVERVDSERGVLAEVTGERDDLARLRDATVAGATVGSDERDEALARVADLDAALAGVRARPKELDAERSAAVAAAAAATARLEALLGARERIPAVLGPAEDGSALRMGEDVGELRDLVGTIGSLGGLRGGEQAEILRWLDGLTGGTVATSAAALSLIESVRAVEEPWQEAAARGIEGDPEVSRLSSERADLTVNHEMLMKLSQSGVLGDTAKAEIDAAHIAVLQAPKGSEAAASSEELRILERYGFDSYLEFTIDTSTRSVGQAVEAKLADLDRRVKELDGQLSDARNAAADRLERLAAEREPAQERVTAFLGERPSGSSIEALALVPEVPRPVTRMAVTVDEAIEVAREQAVAQSDLVSDLDDEERAVVARLEELARQKEALTSRLVELDEILGRATAESESIGSRLVSADVRIRDLERSITDTLSELDRLDSTPGSYSTHDVGSVVEAVLSRMDIDAPTPLPVVLSDVFAPLSDGDAVAALQALVTRAERNQVVYLTGSAAVRAWAGTRVPEDARVVDMSHGRWSPRRLGRRVLGRG